MNHDRPPLVTESIQPSNAAPEWSQIVQDISRHDHPTSINRDAPMGNESILKGLENLPRAKDAPTRDPNEPIICFPRHHHDELTWTPVRNKRDLEKLLKEKIFADEPEKKDGSKSRDDKKEQRKSDNPNGGKSNDTSIFRVPVIDMTIPTEPHTTIFLPKDEAKPVKSQESESQIKERLKELIRDWSPKGSSNLDKGLMLDVLTGEVRSWNYFDLKQDAGPNRKF